MSRLNSWLVALGAIVVVVGAPVCFGQSSIRAKYDQGAALFAQGDYAGAEPLLREAMRGSRDPEVQVAASNRLGILLNRVGRQEESVGVYEAGIQVCRRMGSWQGEANLLGNMAQPLRGLYRWEEAERADRAALSILRNNGGAPEDVVSAYVGLGSSLSGQRKHEEALRALEDGLAEADRGRVSSSTLGQLHTNIAFINTDLRQWDKADESFTRAMDVLSRDPAAWREFVHVCNNAAFAKQTQGDLRAAESWNSKAIRTFRQHAQQPDALLALVVHNRAELLSRMNDPDADAAYKEALALRETTLGTNHPDYAVTAMSYAESLRKAQKLDEAELWAQKAVDVASASLEPRSEIVLTARGNLAAVHADQGKLDLAIKEGLAIVATLRESQALDSSIGFGTALTVGKWERMNGGKITTIDDWLPTAHKMASSSAALRDELLAKHAEDMEKQLRHAGREEDWTKLRAALTAGVDTVNAAPTPPAPPAAQPAAQPQDQLPELSDRATSIVEALKGGDPAELVLASERVKKLKGNDRSAIVPHLLGLAQTQTGIQRTAALTALTGVAKEAMTRRDDLIKLIERVDSEGDSMTAVGVLAIFSEAGAAAKPALPALKNLRKRGGVLSQMVPYTISQIEDAEE